MYEFGYRMYCLRKMNHLTQAELAEKIGVTSGAVSSWESCKSIPAQDKLEQIAALFGTTAECLLGSDSDAAIENSMKFVGMSQSEFRTYVGMRVSRPRLAHLKNKSCSADDDLHANDKEECAGKIGRFNHEGYYDPTAYEALNNADMALRAAQKERTQRLYKPYRPIIYVCSPYAGNVEKNVAAAQEYCKYVVSRDGIPIAPHLFFPQFMDDNKPDDRELAAMMSLTLLKKCTEIWVFGDLITPGMQREIRKARQNMMFIRHFTTDCQEVRK